MMNDRYKKIKERASRLREKADQVRLAKDYARVVGVLSGLGFLIAPDVKPLPRSKVSINLALEFALVEPRILEVLPAAVLSFPRSFFDLAQAPEAFLTVVDALRLGHRGPDFRGLPFQKFYEAADRPVSDKRRKAVSERRLSKTFRFSQETLQAITRRAEAENITHTDYLEQLVARDCAGEW